jgi:flagellar motor switch/type III secretory pathway protein FliN
MSAREWLNLAPGDVVATGNALSSPVVLRVAGQQVASGELVNLEGELGVRITKLG